jgi:hypothetical protein
MTTYNPDNIRGRWALNGTKLIFRHPKIELFWEMPSGYIIPRDALLSLAEFLLLTPHGEKVITLDDPRGGTKVAVAYSGGVDSAAALQLLPDPIPIYTQVAVPKGLHKLDNALLAVSEVSGYAIISNYDDLPTIYGKRHGFFGAAGFTVTSVLLADFLDLKIISDGNILEFAYLDQGIQFKNRNYFSTIRNFERAGLRYCMPNAGLTEIWTTRIASTYRFSMGCMRGIGGEPCLRCFKCYRKSALKGHIIPSNPETEKRLALNPIPMLHLFLWAREKFGLTHPSFASIRKDIFWVDKWYPASVEYLPLEIRAHVLERFHILGIQPLEEVSTLESWISRV